MSTPLAGFDRFAVKTSPGRGIRRLPRRENCEVGHVARVPKGMVPLATVLLLHQVTGSYALAGLTAALVAAGDAASTPAQGRLIDRAGRGQVLIPTAAVHVAAVTALLLLGLLLRDASSRTTRRAGVALDAGDGTVRENRGFRPARRAARTGTRPRPRQ